MISCTEFIPFYSEVFKYLESKKGRAEVDRYWDDIFSPDDMDALRQECIDHGVRGCWNYFTHTLNEEAADFTMYLNEKQGWYRTKMHRCPSKGKLLDLKAEFGYEPFHDYCLHCDFYRLALHEAGLEYIFDFDGIDEAKCLEFAYDPKIFDGRIIIDEDTKIQDVRASDNEYFHRDFNIGYQKSLRYLEKNFGHEGIVEYFRIATKNVYVPVIRAIREGFEDGKTAADGANAGAKGLAVIEAKIRDSYHREHADDAAVIKNDGKTLSVTVKYCPVVKYIKDNGAYLSGEYRYATEIPMRVLAEEGGYAFEMVSYDEETGAAEYTFTARA